MKTIKLTFAIFIGLIGCVGIYVGTNWIIQNGSNIRLVLTPGGRSDFAPWFLLLLFFAPLGVGLLCLGASVVLLMQVNKDR